MPMALKPYIMAMREAEPSVIATSTTCPWPVARAWVRAASTPEGEVESAAAEVSHEVSGAGSASPPCPPRAGRRRARCSSCRGPRRARRGRSGPSRSCARTRAWGWRAKASSGPSPSRSITPGRKPSIRMSDRAMIARQVAFASVALRSRCRVRRPRCVHVKRRDVAGAGPVDPHHLGPQIAEQHASRTAPGRCRQIPLPARP